ncbi:hypothetical protein Moror_9612 [Moniliophthora roreri MCA 2997]|uniref:Uncharacterized protein n=2 Tax=Moniliophthora roreri TaxID=221103 RepID=A0A0W0G5F1_MONRR|nr:hypothetical protein Moror_9612 [Moniliophthora roreri MCA 2997]
MPTSNTTTAQNGSFNLHDESAVPDLATQGPDAMFAFTILLHAFALVRFPIPLGPWISISISSSTLITVLVLLSCCPPTRGVFLLVMQTHYMFLILVLDQNILYPLMQPYFSGPMSFLILAIIIWLFLTIFLRPIILAVVNSASTVHYDFSAIPSSVALAAAFGYIAMGLKYLADGFAFLDNLVQMGLSGGEEMQGHSQQNPLVSVGGDHNGKPLSLKIHHDIC